MSAPAPAGGGSRRRGLAGGAPLPTGAIIGLWIVVAVLWIVLDVVRPLADLGRTGGDFRAYHQAARALASGESPYSEPAFIYPPLLPVLLLPLATLPLEAARVTWFALSVAALAAAFWIAARSRAFAGTEAGAAEAAERRPRVAVGAVAAVWVLGGTVPANLVLGQVNPILLLLLVVAMATVSRRPVVAAAAVGIAAALKVWPAALLAAFALRRQWRALGWGLAVAGALVAVPTALAGAMVEGPLVLPRGAPRLGTAAPLNISLPGLALRVLDPPRDGELPQSWIEGVAPGGFEPWRRHGRIAAAVAAATLLGGLAALWPRRSAAGGAGPLDLGALTALATLAAPVGWYHYQLCQLPAFATVLRQRLERGSGGGAVAVTAVLMVLTHAPAWAFGRYVARWGWTAQAPLALWMATAVGPLVALGWALWLARSVSRGDA